MFEKLDNHRLEKECLDIYTYDSYPNFVYCLEEDPKNDRKLNDRKLSNSMHLDWNYALKYSILRIDQAIDLERRNMICRIVIIVKVI